MAALVLCSTVSSSENILLLSNVSRENKRGGPPFYFFVLFLGLLTLRGFCLKKINKRGRVLVVGFRPKEKGKMMWAFNKFLTRPDGGNGHLDTNGCHILCFVLSCQFFFRFCFIIIIIIFCWLV